MSELVSAALTLLVGLAGGVAGYRFKLPGGGILWAMVSVVVVRLPFAGFVPLDSGFRVVAQILMGTVIGSLLTRSPFTALRPVVKPVLAFLAVVLAVAVASGFAFAAVTGLPLLTALFSTAPGGASDMSAAALQLEADAALVAGFHLARQLVIFVVLVLLFSRLYGGGTPHASLDDT